MEREEIMKRFFTVLLVLVLVTFSASAATTAYVTGGWLRLRDAPSYDSNTIASYYTGTKVTILSSGDGWSRVQMSDGTTGYMVSAYLTSTPASASSSSGNAVSGSSIHAEGYVTSTNGGRVALRTGAGKSYAVITYCNVGTKVIVLNAGSTWNRIQVGNTIGYMMAKYITYSSVPATPSAPQTNITAYVTSENGKAVNLREGAGTGYRALNAYKVGTQVTILSVGTTWDYIQVGNLKGYMMKKYLTSVKPGTTPSSPIVTGSAYVISDNGKAVRLRSGPGTSYSVIGLYNVHTPVTILTSGATWSKIQLGNQVGYMMSRYLSSNSTNPPVIDPGTPAVYTAYIVSENGKGVYLRTAPSIADNVIALYPVGTEVKVLKTNGTWDYISIGTRTGYMMHQFLTTNYTGSTITAVSISSLTPRVGDTIVAVTVPGGATASYTWINDLGKVLSSESYYVVQSSDIGRKIRVRAIGTGNYSGSATSAFTETVATNIATQNVTGCQLSHTAPRVGDTVKASATPAQATVSYIWYREDNLYLGTGGAYTVSSSAEGYGIYAVAIGYDNWTGSVASATTAKVLPKEDVTLSGSVTLPAASVVGKTLTPTLSLNSYEINYHWYQNGVEIGTGATLNVDSTMVGDDIRLVVTAKTGSGYSGSVGSNYCLIQSSVSGAEKAPVTADAITPVSEESALTVSVEAPLPEETTAWIAPEPVVIAESVIPVTPVFLEERSAAEPVIPDLPASPIQEATYIAQEPRSDDTLVEWIPPFQVSPE